MNRLIVLASVLLFCVVTGSGCLITAATIAGVSAAKALSENDTLVSTWLDGQQASVKKEDLEASMVDAKMVWDVSISPTFKYALPDPAAVGSVRSVQLEIFEKGLTDEPVYLIYAKSDRRSDQFRPDTEYSLGSIGQKFNVIDRFGAEADGVVLDKDKKYLLQVTITGKVVVNKHITFKTKYFN